MLAATPDERPMSRARIFAYGSNMHPGRMRERLPAAEILGVARLLGHRLVMNKRGRDGSAKANLERDARGQVWGVLWDLSLDERAHLDGFEGGYERIRVSLTRIEGEEVEAEVYVSERRIGEPVAYDWYKAYLVDAARHHGFPADYLTFLEALPSRPDPSRDG